MTKPKKPRVVILDQVKDQMARDPEMAKAVDAFAALAKEAMEGVASGKYPSFDVAMEFLTGHKPRVVSEDEVVAAMAGEPTWSDDDDEEPEAN